MNTCWIHCSRSNTVAGITEDYGRTYCAGWAELIDWGRRIRVVLVGCCLVLANRPRQALGEEAKAPAVFPRYTFTPSVILSV